MLFMDDHWPSEGLDKKVFDLKCALSYVAGRVLLQSTGAAVGWNELRNRAK
jgi:hypothetical protein